MARATMVDLQRVRSMAMFEASASVVPSSFRYLPWTSPSTSTLAVLNLYLLYFVLSEFTVLVIYRVQTVI